VTLNIADDPAGNDHLGENNINNNTTANSNKVDQMDVKKQVSQSMSWYRLSADKTDARTQNSIGRMYEIGRGVPIDYHTALEWYLKAAKQNNKSAFSNIGLLFQHGKGVSVDTYKALEWFCKDNSNVVKTKTLTDQGVYISKRDQSKLWVDSANAIVINISRKQ
jgi:hypothetical protein